MKKENFTHLVGKSRNQIKQEIGDGFNYFNNDIWTYELEKTWFGRRTIFAITFKDGKAFEIDLFKSFNRC